VAKKRHHYNPQYYLQGFTESSNSRFLWRYDKNKNADPIKMNVVNAGVKTDYYAVETPGGDKDRDTIENDLNNQVEQPANPIIGQLRNGNFTLNSIAKSTLATYLYVTIRRVPKNRQRTDSLRPMLVAKLLEDLPQRMAMLKNFGLNIDKHEATIRKTLADWGDSTPDFLYSPECDPNVERVIASMYWYFLLPADGFKFLSSDNPVVFTEGKGLLAPDGQILFPISQDLVLFTDWQSLDISIPFKADAELTRQVNSWLVRGAVQYVYACYEADWIKGLIKENSLRSDEN
jgi:hypothetical protein